MPKYSYSVFGLIIESELECPEFQECQGQPDISIQIGNVPGELSEPLYNGVHFQTNENEFLLKVNDVADYYITGNKITIQPQANTDLDSVRVFLYGSALAALLIQNSIMPLHANALEKDGKGFLIAGVSGAGKSTLTTAFYQKGYNILSDDVTVLKIEEDRVKALPGIIYPKLWEETFEQIGEDKSGLKKIRPDINKYRFTRIDRCFNKEHEIKKMFIIDHHNSPEITIKEIKTHKKLVVLLENVFRKRFVQGEQIKSQQFLHFSGIAAKMELYNITRPNGINTIKEMTDLIESKL